MIWTIRNANTREKKTEIIVDFGRSRYGGARIADVDFLLDCDCRRDAFDQFDVGLVHAAQELPGV